MVLLSTLASSEVVNALHLDEFFWI